MIAGMLLFQSIPDKLLLLFDASDEMLRLGVPALRIISLGFPLAGFWHGASSVFQAAGLQRVFLMIVSLIRQLVVLIPCAYVIGRVTGDVTGVWWAFFISELVSLMVSALYLRRVNRNVIRTNLISAPSSEGVFFLPAKVAERIEGMGIIHGRCSLFIFNPPF